jgi:hypothetical protein
VTVQHIVLFSFPRELTEAEAGQMLDMVASWPAQIGLMTKCRLGTDLTGARNRGYSQLLYAEFPDLESMKAYQEHPVHLRFVDWLKELECTPLAFDYHLDDETVLMPETPSGTEAPAGEPTG